MSRAPHRFPVLVACLVVALGLGFAGSAAALPANPWTGQWAQPQGGDVAPQLITLTQTGSQISGTQGCPGSSSSTGITFTGTASADDTTASFAYTGVACTGVGGTFTGTLSQDARTVTGTGTTQFGTGFGFTWTYVAGGTEPRVPPPPPPPPTTTPAPAGPQNAPIPAKGCPSAAAPWTGEWVGDTVSNSTLVLVQSGSGVTGAILGAESTPSFTGTASGSTLSGTSSSGSRFDLRLSSPTTVTGTENGRPYSARLDGCPGTATGAAAPNLQTTIPNPQTLNNGPTSIVAPGTISLASLRRSKCVLVKVASSRPARVLVSIFSGRLSIRLFGQQLVVFTAPARRQVCIPVPFRAHTFNVRTPLKVALGYTSGARRQTSGPKPKPVIRPIKLVP